MGGGSAMEGCEFILRLMKKNRRPPMTRKPPTIPPTIPPIAPPERPLLPDDVDVFDDDCPVAEVVLDAPVSMTVIVSMVSGFERVALAAIDELWPETEVNTIGVGLLSV